MPENPDLYFLEQAYKNPSYQKPPKVNQSPEVIQSVIQQNVKNINAGYEKGYYTEAIKNKLLQENIGQKPLSVREYQQVAQQYKIPKAASSINEVPPGAKSTAQAVASEAVGVASKVNVGGSIKTIAGFSALGTAVSFVAQVATGAPPLKAAFTSVGSGLGQFAGGVVGAAVGTATTFGAGAVVGAFLGGTAGGYAGATAGENLYDFLFEKKDKFQPIATVQKAVQETEKPSFKGGQCAVDYYVTISFTEYDVDGSIRQQRLLSQQVKRGPIRGTRNVPEAKGNNQLISTQVGYSTASGEPVWEGFAGWTDQSYRVPCIEYKIHSVTRVDGLPDNCGDVTPSGKIVNTTQNITNNYITNNIIQQPPYSPAGSIAPNNFSNALGSGLVLATKAAASSAIPGNQNSDPTLPGDRVQAPSIPTVKIPANTPISIEKNGQGTLIIPGFNEPMDLLFPTSDDSAVDEFLNKVGTPFQLKSPTGESQTFVSPGNGATVINIPGMQPITYDPSKKPVVKDAFQDLINSGTYVPHPLLPSDPFTSHPLTPTVLTPSKATDKPIPITLKGQKNGSLFIDENNNVVDPITGTKVKQQQQTYIDQYGKLVTKSPELVASKTSTSTKTIDPIKTTDDETKVGSPIPKIPGLTEQQVIIDSLVGIGLILKGIQNNTTPDAITKASNKGACNALAPGGCGGSIKGDAAAAAANSQAANNVIQGLDVTQGAQANAKLDRIERTIGVAEFPASVPASAITSNGVNPPQTTLENIPQFLKWQYERFDEATGQFSIPINVTGVDGATKNIEIPNIAEGIGEMYGIQLQNAVNIGQLLNITTRGLIEAGQIKQQTLKTHFNTQATMDYLGFGYKEKNLQMPLLYKPGEGDLLTLLTEHQQEVKVVELSEKHNLKKIFERLLRAAAIIEAVFFRKIDTKGTPDDVKKRVSDNIKKSSDLNKKINKKQPDAEGKDNFDRFIEEAEIGFTNYEEVTDKTHPYGDDFDNRPKITRAKKQPLGNKPPQNK